MARKKKYEVFISYSREDANDIAPIINVIRAMKKNLVFQDYQALEFGKPWEPALLEALANSKIVIVFWCYHSAESDYVRKEYQLAIESKKDILPIMLDDTTMPKDLAAYQGISFRDFAIHRKKEKGPEGRQRDLGKVRHPRTVIVYDEKERESSEKSIEVYPTAENAPMTKYRPRVNFTGIILVGLGTALALIVPYIFLWGEIYLTYLIAIGCIIILLAFILLYRHRRQIHEERKLQEQLLQQKIMRYSSESRMAGKSIVEALENRKYID